MDTSGIMSEIFAENIPGKQEKNDRILVHIFKNPRAAQIVTLLCHKKGSYLNEIQKKVGGSKTKTIQTLQELEKLKIIKSDWQVEELKDKSTLKARAVKQFRLSEDKSKLLELYEPLFRRF